MHILVCNDDGIYSPGIAALARVAAEFGRVRVVAPDAEQSSMGHAVTASRPLSYRPLDLDGIEAYRVNGTPADCVALGCYHWEQVDVVLSGINLGLNLGHSIWHSGTLAAAKQATLLGRRGIALSAPATEQADYERYTPWLRSALGVLLPLSTLPLVNVNFPREPRGLMWTRVSVRHYDGHVVPTRDPMDRPLYWFTTRPLEDADEGTDRWAVERDWASITPLRIDLTDEQQYQRMHRDHPLDEDTAAASSPFGPIPEAARSVREDEAMK